MTFTVAACTNHGVCVCVSVFIKHTHQLTKAAVSKSLPVCCRHVCSPEKSIS